MAETFIILELPGTVPCTETDRKTAKLPTRMGIGTFTSSQNVRKIGSFICIFSKVGYTLDMSYWPKPKVIEGETTYYVSKTPGTYTVSGKQAGGKKVVVKTKTLKHTLLYLLFDLNTNKHFAVGVCGNVKYIPHRIYVKASSKYWALLVVAVDYGWTKTWWKPWKYLHIKKGGPNIPKIK